MEPKSTFGPAGHGADCRNENYKAGQANRSNSSEQSQSINPANLAAERSVLGALIEDDSLLPEVVALGLRIDDFLLSDHRRIFAAIELLTARKLPVDYISVTEQLGNRQEDYILVSRLIYGVVLEEEHVRHHAAIVRRKARLRALLRLGEWILAAVTETAAPDALIAHIKQTLDACSEDEVRA